MFIVENSIIVCKCWYLDELASRGCDIEPSRLCSANLFLPPNYKSFVRLEQNLIKNVLRSRDYLCTGK